MSRKSVQPDDLDAQLILSFQGGNESAFETLYARHYLSILNVAYRLLGDKDTAEDIAQEIFVKLYQSPRSYSPGARLSTWLYRVTYNACIDELRKRRNAPAELAPDIYPIESAESPDQALQSSELASAVRAAIAALPEKQRIAVVLQRYEGLSYQEIAGVLKTSVSAIQSLLFRARESLENNLASYLKETESI